MAGKKKKGIQYAVAKKIYLFTYWFFYPMNIYKTFIKPFLYTKHCVMWYKVVFYGNHYDQYFESNERR